MRLLLIAFAIGITIPARAPAQGGIARPAVVPSDSVRHGPSPMGYFFRSFIIPGWGQAALDRKLTGALFVAVEGLSIGMAMKTSTELAFLDKTDTATATLRRAEREDWIALLVFNHLFSGLEAYVSAHLVDFPRDLHLRAFPGSRPGFGVVIGTP